MARTVRIERFIWMPGTGGNEGFAVMATIAPGETVTRVVLQVNFSYLTNVLLEAADGGGLWGVMLLGDTESPTSIDLETGLDLDWMWWEGVSSRPYWVLRDSVNGNVDMSLFPADAGYREIKAQRKAKEGFDTSELYFMHKNINPNNIPWTPWITASVFILEVAV